MTENEYVCAASVETKRLAVQLCGQMAGCSRSVHQPPSIGRRALNDVRVTGKTSVVESVMKSVMRSSRKLMRK